MTRSPFARALTLVFSLTLVAACAETTAPLPPPDEVLLVVNSTEASLSIIPVEAPAGAVKVPLGGVTPTPVGVAALNDIALVPMGLDNSVVVVDLRNRQVLYTIGLPAGSGATGVAIVDDSLAYVANPNLNTVTRVNYRTRDTASVTVGVYPDGLVYTRGKLFVLNANLVQFSPAGPSWITVIDPVTNLKASGIDSIPLPGPGNAGFADVGGDGLLYAISTGSLFSGEGRLSIVDPVGRDELGNFGGFGTGPGALASDGDERLFVSSFSEGLMEFDTRTRAVVLGAGNGVSVPGNSAVEVDSKGRIYAIGTGPCQGGQGGSAHVLRPDLTESKAIPLGECAIFALTVSIPPQ